MYFQVRSRYHFLVLRLSIAPILFTILLYAIVDCITSSTQRAHDCDFQILKRVGFPNPKNAPAEEVSIPWLVHSQPCYIRDLNVMYLHHLLTVPYPYAILCS